MAFEGTFLLQKLEILTSLLTKKAPSVGELFNQKIKAQKCGYFLAEAHLPIMIHPLPPLAVGSTSLFSAFCLYLNNRNILLLA